MPREKHGPKRYMHLSIHYSTAVFTTAKTWKQPKCPSIEEWIKKMWSTYIYIMEYYPAIKKKEIKPFAGTWMDLESVIMSEVSQTRRRNIIWYPLHVELKKKWYKWTYLQNRKRLTDLENELIDARGKGQLRTLGRSCPNFYI